VQVDFYLPERFGLEYVGADGARHRPVMVHRSIIAAHNTELWEEAAMSV
jgi:threonyl-tRNA synthetase